MEQVNIKPDITVRHALTDLIVVLIEEMALSKRSEELSADWMNRALLLNTWIREETCIYVSWSATITSQ